MGYGNPNGRRLRVYIAGPIAKGDLHENISRATAAFFRLARAGFAPLCPHWSCFAGGPYKANGVVVAIAETLPNGSTHADWIGADLPWVEVADAVLRLPGESQGADAETAHARAHGIPVFHATPDVIEWAKLKAELGEIPAAMFAIKIGASVGGSLADSDAIAWANAGAEVAAS